MRAGEEGRVGGLGEEGILVDVHVLGTEIFAANLVSNALAGISWGIRVGNRFKGFVFW